MISPKMLSKGLLRRNKPACRTGRFSINEFGGKIFNNQVKLTFEVSLTFSDKKLTLLLSLW